MRIALGGISHEANSFCARTTGMADFRAHFLARGDEILAHWQTTRTEQAGALSVLTQLPGCTIVPALLARALSGGPVHKEAFACLCDELIENILAAQPLDGVQLVLHGAMMAEDESDATGKILA